MPVSGHPNDREIRSLGRRAQRLPSIREPRFAESCATQLSLILQRQSEGCNGTDTSVVGQFEIGASKKLMVSPVSRTILRFAVPCFAEKYSASSGKSFVSMYS